MADIFSTQDTLALLKDKFVVFIGDSNVRALYKDLVWLLNHNTLINHNCLRRKLEKSYLGDQLVKASTLTKSRDFFEIRSYQRFDHYIRFYFVTRCYCDIIINLVTDIEGGILPVPDIIIMNSCLWDVTRWGPNGVEEYKENMVKLMELLRITLPSRTLFIWTTALPIGLSSVGGGLMIKQIEFMERSLRFHIMEANLFTKNLVESYGFDVVDFHYHLQFQISRRSCDGVHFLPLPVRLQTNLLLTHIALSWGRILPDKGDVLFIEDEKELAIGKTINEFNEVCFNYYSGRALTTSDKDYYLTKNQLQMSTQCSNGSERPSRVDAEQAAPARFKDRSDRYKEMEDAVKTAGCIMRGPFPIRCDIPPLVTWEPALHRLQRHISSRPLTSGPNKTIMPNPQTTSSASSNQTQVTRTPKQLKRLQRNRRKRINRKRNKSNISTNLGIQ